MTVLQTIDDAINTARVLLAGEKLGSDKEITILGLYHRLIEVRNGIMVSKDEKLRTSPIWERPS